MKINFKSNQDITQLQQTKLPMQQVRSVQSEIPNTNTLADGSFSFVSSLSEKQLELLRYLIQNYSASSLFDRMDELMRELSKSMDPALVIDKEMVETLRAQIADTKYVLLIKDFSGASVQKGLEVYKSLDTIEQNLVTLASLLKQTSGGVKLGSVIEDFINHLESLKLFNYEGLDSIDRNQILMFFPLIAQLEKSREEKINLWVSPEYDAQGNVCEDKFHFVVSIVSETIGNVSLHCEIDGKKLNCLVRVESSHSKKIFDDHSRELAQRLKKIKFSLNNFNCVQETAVTNTRLFSGIETIA